MTSDASQEIVLHAIDSHPDDLLTKPFSIDELKLRLDNLVRRKQVLYNIERAIEYGDLETAVEGCDEISRSHPCYDYAQRIRAQCLLDLGRADEALAQLEKQFWQTHDKETGCFMGQALFDLKRYDEAERLLLNLLENYPLMIAAHDLLARLYEQQGNLNGACETLKRATRKSPLGIPRQMELGRVATQTDAFDIAEIAYRKSIILGRTSCYRSSEPYLRLANIRRLEMKSADVRKQKELFNDVELLLNNAEFAFPKDNHLRIRSALLRAQVCKDLDDETNAKRFEQEARKLNYQLEVALDLERENIALSGDKVPVLDKPETADSLKHIKRDTDMAAKVTRLGVKHYLADKWAQAIRYFGLAIEYDPSYAPALINLAQLYLEHARDNDDKSSERIKMMDRYLRLVSRLQLNPSEKLRYEQLIKLRQLPIKQLPEGPIGQLLR